MNSAHKKLYLVALALGPVQDFIAAARRTRDLWFGSFLLSEISKAAAFSLHQNQGEHGEAGLVFPATNQPDIDLQPCDTNSDKDGAPPFNVPNKLLAVIETDDPKQVLDVAKKAAEDRWKVLADKVFDQDKKPRISIQRIDGRIWDQQRDDLLELFAAWVAYDPQHDRYAEKRQRLERLLAARKNTRDFQASQVKGDCIPKSSLDGLRESVIHEDKLESWEKRALGLSAGEQLDCPGLVKRRGGEPEQFRPLSRIAADPWLRHVKDSLPEGVIGLVHQIHKADLGLASKVRGLGNDQFGFDGQLLYPFRIQAEKAQVEKLPPKDRKGVPNLLDELETELRPIIKKYGEPSPYVAILAADGDRMGELINHATSKEQHQGISLTLSDYAKQVASIADENQGQLIYAGGDDVLILVPLDKILQCAKALAERFEQQWNQLKEFDIHSLQNKPTLSVGIGISHMLTPMGRQLALAREAEQIAKANQHPDHSKRKNGLAILYQPRSGERIEFREQWDIKPEKVLEKWQELHASQELPFRAAYQLRELGRVIGSWCNVGHELLPYEVNRVLDRKRIDENKKVKAETTKLICERGVELGFSKLADELILTQKLANHTSFGNTSGAAEKEAEHA